MGSNYFKNWTAEMVIAHNKKVTGGSLTKVPHNLENLKPSDFDDLPAKKSKRYAIDPYPHPVRRFNEMDYEIERKHFSIVINPMGAVRCNRSVAWKRTPSQEAYFAYKNRLRTAFGDVTCPDEVKIIAYIKMPDSWSKKKKAALNGFPHRQKPDADNITKGVKDSLFKQDEAVWSESCKKFWAEKGLLEITLVYWKKKI